MNLLFYTPFKPLDHARPSGDLTTAIGLRRYLENKGHHVTPVSDLRCRWIYWRPWIWPRWLREYKRVVKTYCPRNMDLWFTYHSYYKAPDLLGPLAARRIKIPYVIFQGIYSTKRRRRLKTWPGFVLNKKVLCAASHVFTNKKIDLHNLKRLLPPERVTYVTPGISLPDFRFDSAARNELRGRWGAGDDPVVFAAAMFRPDVKTEGLKWVIRACGQLQQQGRHFKLVIAGDGREKKTLQRLAEKQMPGGVMFVGKITRREMYRYYSAADVFAFPGINESLGMVFLEAQCCRLPVVAFDNAGVPEAVQNGKTGILVPKCAVPPFADAIATLLADRNLRQQMGRAAAAYVRENHDLNKNYRILEMELEKIAACRQRG
jgi:glycosyltransferase involved in cell wall biosynthesis